MSLQEAIERAERIRRSYNPQTEGLILPIKCYEQLLAAAKALNCGGCGGSGRWSRYIAGVVRTVNCPACIDLRKKARGEC